MYSHNLFEFQNLLGIRPFASFKIYLHSMIRWQDVSYLHCCIFFRADHFYHHFHNFSWKIICFLYFSFFCISFNLINYFSRSIKDYYLVFNFQTSNYHRNFIEESFRIRIRVDFGPKRLVGKLGPSAANLDVVDPCYFLCY